MFHKKYAKHIRKKSENIYQITPKNKQLLSHDVPLSFSKKIVYNEINRKYLSLNIEHYEILSVDSYWIHKITKNDKVNIPRTFLIDGTLRSGVKRTFESVFAQWASYATFHMAILRCLFLICVWGMTSSGCPMQKNVTLINKCGRM